MIPIPLLDRGRVAGSLIAADRALEPLLRDFALTGQPSEFALSRRGSPATAARAAWTARPNL